MGLTSIVEPNLQLDEIHPPPSNPPQAPHLNIIGGAGTFAALGARLHSPPPLSATVAHVIDAGPDFPPSIRSTILSWRTNAIWRSRTDSTTRAWNGYRTATPDRRDFCYLTAKRHVTVDDLPSPLLRSKVYHLICSPDRCIQLVQRLLARRLEHAPHLPRPQFVWEPVPDRCVPDQLPALLSACTYVDVVSPNHHELSSLLSSSAPSLASIESQALHLVSHSLGPRNSSHHDKGPTVVVRAGELGCLIASPHVPSSIWLPSFHVDQARVTDPTGAGNAFLGGLAVGLARGVDVIEAARWGTISASLCIEQVGVPMLSCYNDSDDKRAESWNGQSVQARLDEFRARSLTPVVSPR